MHVRIAPTTSRALGLHRNEDDLRTDMASGFHQGTEIAVRQLIERVRSLTK
jgi:hypothetical protein